MKHRWKQVDFREVWERSKFTVVGADGVTRKAGTPTRFVGAILTEWCSHCGALRKKFLDSDGKATQTMIRRPVSS